MRNLAIITFASVATMLSVADVSAVEVYNQDGLKLNLKGDYQVQLRKKIGSDTDTVIEYDDLELKFHADYNLGGGVGAFGVVDLGNKGNADGGGPADTLEEGYVGMKFNALKLGIGETSYASDSFGIDVEYEMAASKLLAKSSGGDLIFGSYKFDGASLKFSFDLDETDESSTDLYLTTKAAGLGLGIMYQSYDDGAGGDSTSFGVSVKGKAGGLGYGVALSQQDDNGTDKSKVAFSLKSKLGDSLTGGFGYASTDTGASDNENAWYANVTHAYHKNVKVFLEIGDNNGTDTDLGYAAGLRVRY